jgi:hypothetical protein
MVLKDEDSKRLPYFEGSKKNENELSERSSEGIEVISEQMDASTIQSFYSERLTTPG